MVNWTNITSPADLLAVPNANSSGSFWSATLYMIWVVLLLVFTPFNIEVALLASTFFGIVAGILLAYADLVSWGNVLFFIGELIFTILYIVWSSNRDQ